MVFLIFCAVWLSLTEWPLDRLFYFCYKRIVRFIGVRLVVYIVPANDRYQFNSV